MPELHEHDVMTCRACGRDERASEGSPCADCGTFICLVCTMRGVVFCKSCAPRHEGLGADARDRGAGDERGGGPGEWRGPGGRGESGGGRGAW